MIDKQSDCEIKCIYNQRNPSSGGKGKSVKEAAKACKALCPISNKKRGQKKPVVKPKPKREFNEEDDSDSSDEQQVKRREFYNYLMEQLQENNNE